MPSIAALALVLLLAGVESRSTAIDPEATAGALRIRVGDRASKWSIAVDDAEGSREILVRMREAGGREIRRAFVLRGATVEERSRELAAALALVIEQYSLESTGGSAPPDRGRVGQAARLQRPEGWLAVGARIGAGHPADPDGGATLRGGALWGRAIVQPIAMLATAHARRDALRVDGLRVGAGVAVGSAIRGTPLWIGGAVVPQAAWTLARGRGRAGGWSSVTELGALAQLRVRGLLVGLHAGIELGAPPLRARDGETRLRFGAVRFALGIEIGVLLPTVAACSR